MELGLEEVDKLKGGYYFNGGKKRGWVEGECPRRLRRTVREEGLWSSW